MTELSPHVLYVSQSDPKAKFQSIFKAIKNASEGDQIIVGPGTYSHKTTGECFPLYVPPLCQLIGSGSDTCKIDGGGALQIASRPLDPYQSLVLLGDQTSLSGFTISKSGGHAVSNEQGARILITKNDLRENGQHGLLIFGTNRAVVLNNQFNDNGTKKTELTAPRSDIPAKQGHQIFIEGKAGARNDVTIIGNKLEKTFADGIDIEVFDQPDGVKMHVQAIGNIISGCGRFGFCMAGSYGPSNSDVFIEIRNNQILHTEKTAIDAEAAFSLILKTVHNAKLFMNIVENKIVDCDCGINVIGAFSPSENSHATYNIIGNEISNSKSYGIHAIGGIGMDDCPVENSHSQITIANNKFYEKIEKVPIFVQGGIDAGSKKVSNNSMFLHLVGNDVNDPGKIIVDDGLPTNFAKVLEGSQPYERKSSVVPNDKP